MGVRRKTSDHKPLPDVAFLKECLEYRDDGRLYWRMRPQRHFPGMSDRLINTWNGNWAGKAAGSPLPTGHRLIMVDGQKYLENRLIYHMEIGAIPPGKSVDHVDRDPGNSRLVNLRVCTHAENLMNQAGRPRKHRSLPKHVHFRPQYGTFAVYIRANGKRHYLGTHKNLADAVRIAEDARARLHGQFACDEAR